MAIYTRKKGQYLKLTRDQVRKLQRTSDVIALQVMSKRAIVAMRAQAAWLCQVQKKALKMDRDDLSVTRLPNVDRLLSICDDVDKAINTLRGHS